MYPKNGRNLHKINVFSIIFYKKYAFPIIHAHKPPVLQTTKSAIYQPVNTLWSYTKVFQNSLNDGYTMPIPHKHKRLN